MTPASWGYRGGGMGLCASGGRHSTWHFVCIFVFFDLVSTETRQCLVHIYQDSSPRLCISAFHVQNPRAWERAFWV